MGTLKRGHTLNSKESLNWYRITWGKFKYGKMLCWLELFTVSYQQKY